MCGRYFIEESPELRPIIEAMNRSPLVAKFQKSSAVLSQGEIRPTNVAPVIASSKAGNRAVFPMKWGFTGKTLLINAKTETAAIKPTFREAWACHRCIVPASWYFEWEHMTMNDGKKKTGDTLSRHSGCQPAKSLIPVSRKFCGRFFSISHSFFGKNSGLLKSSIIW